MHPSDVDLLRRFADHAPDAQAAFATLVERHLNLVYSVALRHVRSSQLAEDVAQSVFVDLARHAPRFDPTTPLVAWLHLVARRSAIDVVRRESRRQARERTAVAHATMHPDSPPPDWSAIEPLLDEAVESLPARDRTAILLRYFENKSLRDIGAVIGSSDDATQKRLTRALDHLRTFFARRGITVTATALASDLSLHTLHAAPAGLASAITTTAGLAGTSVATAALETTRVIVMTTLQKSVLAGAFVIVGGAGLYQASVLATQSSELASLRRDSGQPIASARALRAAHAALSRQLENVEGQIDARLAHVARSPADVALDARMREWLARIDQLKDHLAHRPDLNIPELQLLTEDQWFTVASSKPFDSDEALRRATSTLRHQAQNAFAQKLHEALNLYVKTHGGLLPETTNALAPLLDTPLDPTVLARYEVLRQGRINDLSPNDRMRILGVKTPADIEFDAYWWIGVDGYGNTAAMSQNISEARQRFKAAHPGQNPITATATQLAPYLKWPVDAAKLQGFLNRNARAASRP